MLSTPDLPRGGQDPVAVVGLACRLPGNSNTPTAFWNFLLNGGCAENEPPSSRFKLKGHFDGSMKPGTMRSPGGMFLESIDPKDIDARFFALSKADAISMDPQQRQLLEVVYEGLENAGISLEMLKGQAYGCFVGSYASDYNDMQTRDPEDRTPSWTVGSAGRTMLSNRISHFLDIKGPSMTVDTACSGSLISIDIACRYLQTRDMDGAIVAGCNLYLSPEHNMDLSAIRASASPTGRCHTFDAKADGYIKAEAINMVILKRLDDALRDRDPIRAVIRGSYTNSDGWTSGIASPSSEAQARAIRKAYARAGLCNFSETTYLECHGTGTQAGDPIEVNAAASVFSSSRISGENLIIGSVKSNIGHSEPAAGISGLLKAILALENGVIPGNPTFQTPNPKIDFRTLKLHVSKTTIPWPEVPFRRASVNSFGYGGSNAHVVLDEPSGFIKNYEPNHVSSYLRDVDDDFFANESTERPRVLLFSANDESSLKSYSKAVIRHFVNLNVKVKLKDLAYTLDERRSHHFYRAYTITTRTKFEENSIKFGKIRPAPPKIGFVFTGQGAQWSQMGRGLVETFPKARALLEYLDTVLQSLPKPPNWSLLGELVEPRTPNHLRLPEFSQPLVTALQLAILTVLHDWGLHPRSVVGHSSGEIAASVAAGYLKPDAAIKNAYLRGKAAADLREEVEPDLGMLAVGLGTVDVQYYLTNVSSAVQIACINSPQSVTLSGSAVLLQTIKAKVEVDRHFARLLEVDLAYHTDFMTDISARYKGLLLDHCELRGSRDSEITMFSSVTGSKLDCDIDSCYWQKNMVSPVLFQSAMEEMIKDGDADFLIEVGPSGALAGPIAQIKKNLGAQGAELEYSTASKRGVDSVNALLEIAGRIFLSGGAINMLKVNDYEESFEKPLVITDLPNYGWNHSTKYWHESDASKDWRFRTFPHHDLLGSKILGTSWHTPSWKTILRTDDVPWLKDHKIGEDIIFPAAGYMAMAIEALYQMGRSLGHIEETREIFNVSYRLRNVKFQRAMVLEEKVDNKLCLSLAQYAGPKDLWYDFKISSSNSDVWAEHCCGLIRLQEDTEEVAPKTALESFKYSSPAQGWYKALGDVGYNFGPYFQKQLQVESIAGRRYSRVRLSFSDPQSTYIQSSYPMHPVCLDGCLQSGVPSLWQGHRSSIDTALVPAIIDDLVIRSRSTKPEYVIAISTSEFEGTGSSEEAKSYRTHVSAYDEDSGLQVFQMSGLNYNDIDTLVDRHETHTYCRLEWKPDISFLKQKQLLTLFPPRQEKATTGYGLSSRRMSYLVSIAAHRKPNLAVLEVDMTISSRSIWLDPSDSDGACRVACSRYVYTSNNSTRLGEAQEKYQRTALAGFGICNITKPSHEFVFDDAGFDLVIIKLPQTSDSDFRHAIVNAQGLLCKGGYLLIEYNSPSYRTSSGEQDQESDTTIVSGGSTMNSIAKDFSEHGDSVNIPNSSGFQKVLDLHDDREISDNMNNMTSLFYSATEQAPSDAYRPSVSLVHFSDPIDFGETVKESLISRGWHLTTHHYTELDLPMETYVLVLDDVSNPVLPTISADQWRALLRLIGSGHKILWVTAGSQFQVSDPQKAMFHGFARSARAEDPTLVLKTLDVESGFTSESFEAINSILLSLHTYIPSDNGIESEYCERRGIIYTSRILPDDSVNRAERDSRLGAPLQLKPFHRTPGCIRMQCEQPGAMDSLHYSEVSTADLPLDDDFVEVEIHAAGLNYKDVATVIGIIPRSQNNLGIEGAGVVRRVGRLASSYNIGDRVLVDSKGCFANRVQCPLEGLHLLPDSISFEEAATMCTVYLTSIHALIDLANLHQGQSVLIHSAAGGVGIAAIQVCRYIGAEIYATVSSDEKRRFLTESFNIPPENIFSSRTEDFARQLMKATKKKGVDVILNFLTGSLLDESWRCIADRGVLLEIGKKDMLDRNNLSMEPFCRNASYRALDMSHPSITRPMVASLLSRMFKLLEKGHITPISPTKVFSFTEIPTAFRYMRGGSHIGKIVISDGTARDVQVSTRAAPRVLSLREDGVYLIVGGLKGLCGSLAVYLARNGARHLTIVSRSGYQDGKSQAVLQDLDALGAHVGLVEGDVANLDDVRHAFEQSMKPIAGIIQGAMVLRDKTLETMTVEDFHETIRCKVQGTMNLHNAAIEKQWQLDFFTLLSSASGVIGQKCQANYAAGNVFLDSFAAYRHGLGLAACSVNLGVVEDVGYISERDSLAARLEKKSWGGINESLLHKILKFSILQQTSTINPDSRAQMITGIPVPLQEDSELLLDARFRGLFFGKPGVSVADGQDSFRAAQAFVTMVKAKTNQATLLAEAIDLLSRQFTKSLGLDEPMEPAQPLSVYGLDSLSAVELRNWIRIQLGSEITTFDILNATSLVTLCEKVLMKMKRK